MGQQAQRVSEEPLFHIRHGNAVGHGGVTLAELREANADDTDLLGWAEAARRPRSVVEREEPAGITWLVQIGDGPVQVIES